MNRPRKRGNSSSAGTCSSRESGEGWTIRDHRAILRLEPYASADLGAASDMTGKSVESEAASASSPIPTSLQLTSAVIASARGDGVLQSATSGQVGNHDAPRVGAEGRSRAGLLQSASVSARTPFAEYPHVYAALNTGDARLRPTSSLFKSTTSGTSPCGIRSRAGATQYAAGVARRCSVTNVSISSRMKLHLPNPRRGE